MVDEAAAEEQTPEDQPAEEKRQEPDFPKQIYLVSYPKIVFMYPTFLLSLFCGIFMQFIAPGEDGLIGGVRSHSILGMIFLMVFAFNLMVITFEFPRTTSLTLVFFFAALAMGLYLLFVNFPDLLPGVKLVVESIKPYANATFYYLIAAMFAFFYLLVAIVVQFDYWEVRPNELLHHHGFLSDMERMSAPHLRIDKEINDLFEYMLLRSGRLILHPTNERKAVVLENVFFIGRKEKAITRMLGALQVQVRSE